MSGKITVLKPRKITSEEEIQAIALRVRVNQRLIREWAEKAMRITSDFLKTRVGVEAKF